MVVRPFARNGKSSSCTELVPAIAARCHCHLRLSPLPLFPPFVPDLPLSITMAHLLTSNDADTRTQLSVKCGSKSAIFLPNRMGRDGKSTGKCVKYHGKWITPSEFEKCAGIAARKWKQSVRFNDKPIGTWIEENKVSQAASGNYPCKQHSDTQECGNNASVVQCIQDSSTSLPATISSKEHILASSSAEATTSAADPSHINNSKNGSPSCTSDTSHDLQVQVLLSDIESKAPFTWTIVKRVETEFGP